MNFEQFERYLDKNRNLVNRYLERYLYPPTKFPPVIHRAMRYSLLAGGKRVRPLLAIAAYETCGGHNHKIIPAACALEMMHTFSLIHDDLPCMDNDDLRRGKPTCHIKFGEANAVLAGDALCILSFELLGSVGDDRVVRELAHALGTCGMIGGQVVDVASEGQKVSKKTLHYIHAHKTGALIASSIKIGAMISGVRATRIKVIQEYGDLLGMAFQIVDDLLDVLGDPKIIGKPAKRDAERGKNTYPGLYGEEKSKKMALEYAKKAKAIIKSFDQYGLLGYMADYFVNRIS